MALTRKEAENLVWSRTHRDYKGVVTIGANKKIRYVLVLREGGTHSVPLSSLTDAELADRLPKFASFEAAKAKRDEIDKEGARISALINAIPGVDSGPMGLTPDVVKFSEEYRTLAGELAVAWHKLRTFNAWFTKAYSEELAQERKAKRGG
jgi:hypothetical protein